MSLQTKSPIREKSLRQASESARRARLGIVVDRALPAGCLVVVLWVVAFVEWQWLLGGLRPNPVYTTLLAALITVYVVLRLLPELRRLKELERGYEGERATGEYLARLRGLGLRVFNDVPVDSGNIDHVILSTHGVFAAETNTRSKPLRGPCKVFFDGRAVAVNGGPADTSPIVLARAKAAQLRRLLQELTGSWYPVRAVLLYPGWYVESLDARSESEVWVLAPNSLPMWIKHAPETVHGRDVRQAASELTAFLRNYR